VTNYGTFAFLQAEFLRCKVCRVEVC